MGNDGREYYAAARRRIASSMIWHKRTGLASGGIISPGVLAMTMGDIRRVAAGIAVGIAVAIILRLLKKYEPLFGREQHGGSDAACAGHKVRRGRCCRGPAVFGWVVPGLIGADIERRVRFPRLHRFSSPRLPRYSRQCWHRLYQEPSPNGFDRLYPIQTKYKAQETAGRGNTHSSGACHGVRMVCLRRVSFGIGGAPVLTRYKGSRIGCTLQGRARHSSIKRKRPKLNRTYRHRMGPITTTLGALEAKRTAADPRWSIIVWRWLERLDIKRGDKVVVLSSSSFPGMMLNVLAALEERGADVTLFVSLGSSTFGANDPRANMWSDLAAALRREGLLHTRAAFYTYGGGGDVGGTLSPWRRSRTPDACRRKTRRSAPCRKERPC